MLTGQRHHVVFGVIDDPADILNHQSFAGGEVHVAVPDERVAELVGVPDSGDRRVPRFLRRDIPPVRWDAQRFVMLEFMAVSQLDVGALLVFGGQVVELQFTGTRTGRLVRLPVMYAQGGDQLVILVGGPERKRWWRNFTPPHPVRVLLRCVTRTGIGHVVAGSVGRAEAARIYTARFPDLPVRDDPMALITLDPAN